MSFKKTFLPAVILATICLLCAAALAVTHTATKERIAFVERERYFADARSVMPAGTVLEELDITGVEGFVGKDTEGEPTGYVIRTSAKGYGGNVSCVVGFDTSGKLIGLSVRAPDETPGLGVNVKNPGFTDQFVGAEKPPVLFSDVDGVTGATYSSRAVTTAVTQAFLQLEALMKGGAIK